MAHWFTTINPVASYYLALTSSAANKTALLANVLYNIEMFGGSYYVGTSGIETNFTSPADWPLPSPDLSERLVQAEIAEYADYASRPQGPYTFAWGVPTMQPFVFKTYCYLMGFAATSYADTNIWSAAVTVQTKDEMGNYRCFLGTLKRPVPRRDYRIDRNGNFENIMWRFVGCTEIFS